MLAEHHNEYQPDRLSKILFSRKWRPSSKISDVLIIHINTEYCRVALNGTYLCQNEHVMIRLESDDTLYGQVRVFRHEWAEIVFSEPLSQEFTEYVRSHHAITFEALTQAERPRLRMVM